MYIIEISIYLSIYLIYVYICILSIYTHIYAHVDRYIYIYIYILYIFICKSVFLHPTNTKRITAFLCTFFSSDVFFSLWTVRPYICIPNWSRIEMDESVSDLCAKCFFSKQVCESNRPVQLCCHIFQPAGSGPVTAWGEPISEKRFHENSFPQANGRTAPLQTMYRAKYSRN